MVRMKKAEVSKRQYSSKAKYSNIRDFSNFNNTVQHQKDGTTTKHARDGPWARSTRGSPVIFFNRGNYLAYKVPIAMGNWSEKFIKIAISLGMRT